VVGRRAALAATRGALAVPAVSLGAPVEDDAFAARGSRVFGCGSGRFANAVFATASGVVIVEAAGFA
jgi:hypothetical protein